MVKELSNRFEWCALLCAVGLLFSCSLRQNKESPQLKISEGLDTLWIIKEPQHGYYLINDTLTLFSGWSLIDEDQCVEMDHRSKPISTWSKSPYQCRISDLYPAFQVFKRERPDTLHVFKNGKEYQFKMTE
ncbi:MAG: hypothetical protein ACFCUH_05200 [Flavobacteriales bacterium]